jgi:hypothetical protein
MVKNASKSVSTESQEIAALRAQVETLKAGPIAAKLARSNNRRQAALDAGLSAVDVSWAASSTIRKTAKGEIAYWLISRGAGEYTNAQIRKGIKRGFDATAAQVDVALDMLAKGFDLRTGVGFTLAYDAANETVVMTARKAVRAPKKAVSKPRKVKALPAPTSEESNVA